MRLDDTTNWIEMDLCVIQDLAIRRGNNLVAVAQNRMGGSYHFDLPIPAVFGSHFRENALQSAAV
ncbi:MAG: hypothetical protein CMJ78_20905 [Planctomycetaceae bacterium]|nr:hypothetical protein [Planctomycetaceae bacterium]